MILNSTVKRAVLCAFLLIPFFSLYATEKKPNVLFIMIDDLNDWVSPLGGHPQTQTPNMDRFCKEGAVVFQNAVCAAPICGPSRSAILSGFMPNRTGVYGNATNMLTSELVQEYATMPEYFSKNGYYTLANGKIFHKHAWKEGTDFGHWAFDEFARARRYTKNRVEQSTMTGASGTIDGKSKPEYKGKNAKLSWGPTKCDLEEMVDYKVAKWAQEQLNNEFDKPFFMGVGFIKPHLPWFVPKEFFDKFNVDEMIVPEEHKDDLNDIINPNGTLAFQAMPNYKWVKEHGLEQEAVRAYLASINFVDTCLGMVFDALEKSKFADNTIVVVCGDHGWHLGEKQRFLKNTLWLEAAKTPFLVRTPKMGKLKYSKRTVGLIDIYPTLVDMCNLPSKSNLDGTTFAPLLHNVKGEWNRPGVTVSMGGTSVLGEQFHYISNLSGAKEFYDLKKDPMELENLINNPKYTDIINEMDAYVPTERVSLPCVHYDKSKDYIDIDADPSIKKTRILSKLK